MKMNEIDSLIKNVKRLRTERGWSQKDLAEKSNYAQGSVCRVETGLSEPTLTGLCKMAKAFNINVSELIGEHRDERRENKKIKIFYDKYSAIDDLSKDAQKTLLTLIKLLK